MDPIGSRAGIVSVLSVGIYFFTKPAEGAKTKSSFEIHRNTCSGAKAKGTHTLPQRNGCKEHGFESSSYYVQFLISNMVLSVIFIVMSPISF